MALFVRKALLAGGWAEDVRLSVADGHIADIVTDASAQPDDTVGGIAIPGLANAHSHAFQRALAGHTEQRGPSDVDTFWTWRSRMYGLADRIDPARLRSIAQQAYVEMLSSGYTAVAEFHYLHDEPGERRAGTAMLEAIVEAADAAGIRLTYVPVLYERAGFDAPAPAPQQRRFALGIDRFLAHCDEAQRFAGGRVAIGIGAHSLRAVTPTSLDRIVAIAGQRRVPLHMHIAEQQREVDQCLAALDRRPVEWLLERYKPDRHWCLVHATHMDFDELATLAETGAVVCLCPSTEANLGDGLFPLREWLEQHGHIAIGSDSHISINPFEELRWLEYGQRLRARERNIGAIRHSHTGRSLFEMAAAGGALATGQGSGRLEKTAPADLVVLDDDNPMLAGHGSESLLDALVFSGFTLPIDRVMVHGEWQVLDGRHRNEKPIRAEYARVVQSLLHETDA